MSQDAKPRLNAAQTQEEMSMLLGALLQVAAGRDKIGQPVLAIIANTAYATIDRLNAQIATARKALETAGTTPEPSWEDAAMKRQSNVAFKAVVDSANNALVAFDRFIEGGHDGVDFVYEQIGAPLEELRGVLHGAETESEGRR